MGLSIETQISPHLKVIEIFDTVIYFLLKYLK
jgi:hypothetical protein